MDRLILRPARPEDADAAVPLILSAGPAAFAYIFTAGDREAADFLRFAFLQGDGEMGYRNHLVGTLEGEVVAAGALLSGDTTLAFTVAAVKQILRFYGLIAGLGVIRRGLATETVIRPPGRGEHCLVHLGVAPGLRGQGIGRRLIGELLAMARAKGARIASLDVAATNPLAEKLYLSLGFEPIRERRSRLSNRHGAVADHLRMSLMLIP